MADAKLGSANQLQQVANITMRTQHYFADDSHCKSTLT